MNRWSLQLKYSNAALTHSESQRFYSPVWRGHTWYDWSLSTQKHTPLLPTKAMQLWHTQKADAFTHLYDQVIHDTFGVWVRKNHITIADFSVQCYTRHINNSNIQVCCDNFPKPKHLCNVTFRQMSLFNEKQILVHKHSLSTSEWST